MFSSRCISWCGTGAGREGIVTYTGLDASQHTQLPGSAPSLDPTHMPPSKMPPSNTQPARGAAKLPGQAVTQEPSIPGFGAKQKAQAQPSGPNEPDAPVKGEGGPSMGVPTKAMGAATGAAKGKGAEHGRTASKQLVQIVVPDPKEAMDGPAQRQSSPANVGRQQQAGSKAAAQALGPSAGQAAKASRAGGPNHAHEGRPLFGLFPSTQQSSSQPSSKLAMPAVQRTHSAAATATQQQPPKRVQQQQQQQQPGGQQQGRLQQGQQQSRQPPSMSPSESSSVRPPQGASRRMSTGRATPAAGLKGPAGATKQQPQPEANEQENAAEGVHDKEKMASAAARGSAKRLSANAGWKPRRGRKPSPPAADSPVLEVQGGTAAECGTSGLEEKDASKPDEQVQAMDDAQDQGKICGQVSATASVVHQYFQGGIAQQKRPVG